MIYAALAVLLLVVMLIVLGGRARAGRGERPGPHPGGGWPVRCLGLAFGVFSTGALLAEVWIVWPLLAPALLGNLILGSLAGRRAFRHLSPRWLRREALQALALATLPIAAILPYLALMVEARLSVEEPGLPPDATTIEVRYVPLSGGTTSGPMQGVIVEYLTALAPVDAEDSLLRALPPRLDIRRDDRKLYARPKAASVMIAETPEGTRVRVGVFSERGPASPSLLFIGGWVALGVLLLRERWRSRSSSSGRGGPG